MNNNLNNCFCISDNTHSFTKWLLQLLGPVIFGVKPAEIISFPYSDKQNSYRLTEIKRILDKNNKIFYKEFSYCNKCTKILFYNSTELNNILSEYRNLKFLQSIGYPNNYNLNIYLDFIIGKMKTGDIPDEIGIFLGYPLKDVLGFIGHPSLKLTKINGWRVYGDSRISDIKYMQFINAKNKMKELLNHHNVDTVLKAI
ncbi:DUF3793 family protein [Tepidibacter mesophilus]|uniref:DUF3793 family protein n=1 Tax=Tepidibacter mesophilus TaxID=655607 RepID=UPI000C08C774|nr:DUF3793 family protein [Tepidibacter mesophilus]